MKTDVIILAGGLGTRLRTVIKDTPKPMAPVSGKPFLYYILDTLDPNKINTIILSIGFLGEQIQEEFGSEFKGIPIVYAIENEPMGTGGGIKLALEQSETQEVLILNGDTYFKIDLDLLITHHRDNSNDLSLSLKQMDHPSRYGTVLLDEQRITEFKEKNEDIEAGLINGGVYVINRLKIDDFPQAQKFSFEQEVLEKRLNDWKIGGFVSTGFFIDIGIPEDYERAQEVFSS